MPRACRYQRLPMRRRPSCRCCRSSCSSCPLSARAGETLSVYTFCHASLARVLARSGKAGQGWPASKATVLIVLLRQLPAAGTTCTMCGLQSASAAQCHAAAAAPSPHGLQRPCLQTPSAILLWRRCWLALERPPEQRHLGMVRGTISAGKRLQKGWTRLASIKSHCLDGTQTAPSCWHHLHDT